MHCYLFNMTAITSRSRSRLGPALLLFVYILMGSGSSAHTQERSRELTVSEQKSKVVFVTKSGNKYHASGCSYLKSSREMTLDDALAAGYSACSRCGGSASDGSSTVTAPSTLYSPPAKSAGSSSTNPSYSSRCQATTKKGSQCKRSAQSGRSYCWQH